MSRWMVNVRGQQFSASGLDELKQLAKKGDLSGGDIVQPPGAAEWLYAVEVPELKSSLRSDAGLEDLPTASAPSSNTTMKIGGAIVLGLLSVGAWGYALSLRSSIPKPEDVQLLGGSHGLSFSQVLATTNAPIRSTPTDGGAAAATVPQGQKADLLAKHDKFFKIRYNGTEGYVKVDEVVPAYFFADDRTKLDYDPLYNPDKYTYVTNSSWRMSDDEKKPNVSVFEFMLQNDSKFAMTDLKLVATIKNDKDEVVEQHEFPVEGTMPAARSQMVGTLAPAKGSTDAPRILVTSAYEEMLAKDPTIEARWTDGVEVPLGKVQPGNEATVTLVEVRAVPPDQMPTASK